MTTKVSRKIVWEFPGRFLKTHGHNKKRCNKYFTHLHGCSATSLDPKQRSCSQCRWPLGGDLQLRRFQRTRNRLKQRLQNQLPPVHCFIRWPVSNALSDQNRCCKHLTPQEKNFPSLREGCSTSRSVLT